MGRGIGVKGDMRLSQVRVSLFPSRIAMRGKKSVLVLVMVFLFLSLSLVFLKSGAISAGEKYSEWER